MRGFVGVWQPLTCGNRPVPTLNCKSVVIEKGRQFHACAFIAIQNQWDLTRMRAIDDLFHDNRPAIQCTVTGTFYYYPARACAARGKVISRGWWVVP